MKFGIRRIGVSVVFFGAIGLAFLFGGYAHREHWWPFGRGYLDVPEKPTGGGRSEDARPVEPRFVEFVRLAFHPNKRLVECPPQDDRTMVAFVFGQSNAANHGGERHQASDRVANYFQGQCYEGSDPLLGATGVGGTPWGRMADTLVGEGLFDEVILVPAGVIDTSIERWRTGGDLSRLLGETLRGIQGRYRVTHFLWHQGESDYGRGGDYAKALGEVIATTRVFFPQSKFYVSVATRCGFLAPDALLAREQMKATRLAERVLRGPSTDDIAARYDDCHFSGKGLDVVAQRWVQSIKAESAGLGTNGGAE